ncbi:WxL domain-containing protein [Carnobacterium maltaromaticum]|uniref:WxL domain-containing protein n=1 Tax=Carnobacterium maltaromaticum TaxID=2751 RepID=UPI0012F9FD7D|nr:WxL domain-containing protein [Carnobacterium maltaromaticum]
MKKIISTLLLTTTVLSGAGSVLATEYEDAYNARSNVNAEVIAGEDIVNPGPGPEEIETPGPENPDAEIYGIKYISNLDFGQGEFSTEDQILSTQFDADLVGEKGGRLFSHVSIRDIRPQAEREGWNLTVQRDTDFIPGSQLTFAPAFNQNSLGFSESDLMIPSTVSVNASPAMFMSTADANNPAGISAMVNMGDAELTIPANTGAGEYSTTLTWNLVTGPAA